MRKARSPQITLAEVTAVSAALRASLDARRIEALQREVADLKAQLARGETCSCRELESLSDEELNRQINELLGYEACEVVNGDEAAPS